MPEAGIKINGKHYSIPPSLRVGETRQIKRITGLNPPEFMIEMNRLSDTQDPDVGAAMVWWIVHREDPSFTIDMIDDLEWGAIASENGDDDAVPVDPKAEGATSASSPTSAESSSGTSDETGGETTPASGGVLGLAV